MLQPSQVAHYGEFVRVGDVTYVCGTSTWGADYFIRNDQGEIVDRWFTDRYGWKRFWPPSATVPRVERLLRTLRQRAQRAAERQRAAAVAVIADKSLPRRYVSGHDQTVEILVCGRNRYGHDLEYSVSGDGRGGKSIYGNKFAGARPRRAANRRLPVRLAC